MIKNPLAILSTATIIFLGGCATPNPRYIAGQNEPRPQEICQAGNLQNNHFPSFINDPQVINHPYGGSAADNRPLWRSDAPQSYTVVRGDTLWHISRRFLNSPWRWKEIWHNNPQIKNPHLIYPGDRLAIINVNGQQKITIVESDNTYHGTNTGRRTRDGRPVLRYSPHIRSESLDQPITIASGTVRPFVLKTRLIPQASLQGMPFIYGSGMDYITPTMESTLYAKNLGQAKPGDLYSIYRPEGEIVDSVVRGNKQLYSLGQQMKYLGLVTVRQQNAPQDTTLLTPLEIADPLKDGDVLVKVDDDKIDPPNYFPQAPSNQCSQGYIVSLANDHTMAVKEFDTIITSFGRNDGAQVGDVWKIVRHGEDRVINGQKVNGVEKEVGYAMIFRVEDNASLAIVLESSQEIRVSDALVRP